MIEFLDEENECWCHEISTDLQDLRIDLETSRGNSDYHEDFRETIDVVRMLSSGPDPGEEWRRTDEHGSVWITNSEVCRLKRVKVEHQYYRGLVYVRGECLEQAVQEDPGSKRRWIVLEE